MEYNLYIKMLKTKYNKSKHFKFSLSLSLSISVSPIFLSFISFFVCNWFETTTHIPGNLFDQILPLNIPIGGRAHTIQPCKWTVTKNKTNNRTNERTPNEKTPPKKWNYIKNQWKTKLRRNEIESDGPAVVRVNIFVRSISKIDDVTMVSVREISQQTDCFRNVSVICWDSHIFENQKREKNWNRNRIGSEVKPENLNWSLKIRPQNKKKTREEIQQCPSKVENRTSQTNNKTQDNKI